MGRKGRWLSAVKKVLTHESKEKKDNNNKKRNRPKRKWFRKHKTPDAGPLPPPATPPVTAEPSSSSSPIPAAAAAAALIVEEKSQEIQHEQPYSMAISTAVATEAAVAQAVAVAEAAAEVVRLATMVRYFDKPKKEEIAATKIQTAYRGYLARRTLQALKGLVRLKSMIQGESAQRQATSTLQSMQTLARVQSQIRSRRLKITEANQALQKHIQQKRDKELLNFRASTGEDWDHSTQSKEHIEANLQSKQEAAIRRERALAYAYTHQQKWRSGLDSGKSELVIDTKNPNWGWSWLERWMASRPWEIKSTTGTESDVASPKMSVVVHHQEVSSRKGFNNNNNNNNSNDSPGKKIVINKPSNSSSNRKLASVKTSSKERRSSVASTTRTTALAGVGEFDTKSSVSFQSEKCRRRQSVCGSSSERDDNDSLVSSVSSSIPSYMGTTQSARARSKMPMSPLGNATTTSPGGGRKRVSFHSSSTPTQTQVGQQRRHSLGSPKLEHSSINHINVH
ncbi:protein IQ-DOMAIN 3-like isoform X2 [Impatiens glandulifera]|uniref:protein IQ-DOMAIN 3-like isoform X2 n=1 Tax=Impatiens glandulifera TaxID=253017 RepID=UPI001FB12801|nr:protein IQ-DOMAIN 3-like isoform X2 [Impatiens glandulifera]